MPRTPGRRGPRPRRPFQLSRGLQLRRSGAGDKSEERVGRGIARQVDTWAQSKRAFPGLVRDAPDDDDQPARQDDSTRPGFRPARACSLICLSTAPFPLLLPLGWPPATAKDSSLRLGRLTLFSFSLFLSPRHVALLLGRTWVWQCHRLVQDSNLVFGGCRGRPGSSSPSPRVADDGGFAGSPSCERAFHAC